MANVLSERIAELRKARGLTQEQLGQLAGVSAQAVSKWEKGGAPDVELLPALADRLGVTIDALFGREGGEAGDIHQTAARWLHTIPKEQRYDQICRLFWIFTQNMVDEVTMPDIGYLEQAAALWEDETSGIKQWAISRVWLDGGYMLSLHAEDLSFATVWPEPKDGYDMALGDVKDYVALFRLLGDEDAMRLFLFLCTRTTLFSERLAAQSTGIVEEKVGQVLDEFECRGWLAKETADMALNALEIDPLGLELLYRPTYKEYFIFFLFFARDMTVSPQFWYLSNCTRRKAPLLRDLPADARAEH